MLSAKPVFLDAVLIVIRHVYVAGTVRGDAQGEVPGVVTVPRRLPPKLECAFRREFLDAEIVTVAHQQFAIGRGGYTVGLAESSAGGLRTLSVIPEAAN